MPRAAKVRFGGFDLDPETGELWKSGEQIHLQEKPLEILLVLLERPGELVSRAELQKRVWPEHSYLDFDHSINIAVSKLREVLCDSAGAPRFIETLPRRGYRFIAPVERDSIDRAAGSSPARRIGGVAIVGLLLLGLLGIVRQAVFSPGKRRLPAALEQPAESLAVLPFLNLSGNPGEEYIAEGITESIINELGGVASLRVISWQSVLQFKNSSEPLPAIASVLDVDAMVLGSIRLSENRILIHVQLIATKPERHVWTATYEESVESLIEVQGGVARAIAREIAVVVTEQERARLERPVPAIPAAYDAYLKGLHAWNRFSKAGFESAIEQFEHAIALDSGFAAAYAGLADSWLMLAWYGFESPHEVFPRAEEAAKRAVALDPGSARSHNSMAAVLDCYRWDFSAATAHYLRAIELNPSLAVAHNWYSWALSREGSFEKALREARRAQRLDPMSGMVNTSVGVRLYDARRYDEAIDQLLLTLEMHSEFLPAMLFLGMTYQRAGLHEKAIDVLQQAVTDSGGVATYRAALATALGAAGRRSEAEAALARVLEVSRDDNPPAFQIATAFASLDEIERAFEWLETALEARCPWMPRIAIEPLLDPLRDDPRFEDLRRRVGI